MRQKFTSTIAVEQPIRDRQGEVLAPEHYAIPLRPQTLAQSLLIITLFLLLVHVCLQSVHYLWHPLPWLLRDLFDVDVEDSIPTWYSAANLLLCSLFLLAIAVKKRHLRDRWFRHWYGLCAGFVLLSLDEVAGLHETLNTMIDFSWTLPGAIAAAVVATLYVRFLFHLPPRTRGWFILTAIGFLGGALGVERASDWYLETDKLDTLAYNLVNVVEEGLEMLSIVLFLYALLSYMRSEYAVVLSGTREPAPPPPAVLAMPVP